MIQTKILTIKKEMVYTLAQFGILLSVVVLTPALISHQAITGSVVNAVLFISVIILGIQGAVLIALIPSLIALSVGLLPAIMAPMVPFIMMGNVILILCFSYFNKRGYWLGVISASALKFLFLFIASYIIANLFIGQDIAIKASTMFGLPQFLTALGGGIIAYLFLRNIK